LSDSNNKPTATEATDRSRRGFLGKVWLVLGAVVTLQFLWIGFDLLRPRQRRRQADAQGDIHVAGPVERFEPGTVTAFPEGRFYLSRLESGGFLALGRTCTHLGCTVPWVKKDQQFACPCHASVFDITGEVLGPPAERALDLYPVRIENGIVKVDLGQVIQRKHFDVAQVTQP
jgi:cytochrome b6-f complex iron-sulfur subunit